MSASAFLPVVVIFGAGRNIGANVARVFANKGYKVALAARRLQNEQVEEGQLHIHADLADPNSVISAFDSVEKTFGPANVVIYNGASCKVVPAQNPLELSIADFQHDIAVNTTSVLEAARQAVKGFQRLPADIPKTFIYTGNILNMEPILPLFSSGMGKSATAHLIAAASMAYKDQGYRFYYADERKIDGTVPGRAISGSAHADFYYDLVQNSEQGPWLATFVAGEGYKSFPGTGYVKDPMS